MFRGSQTSKIDQKGRLVIPSLHRDQLLVSGRQGSKEMPKLVLTGHPAKYLMLLPAESYLKREKQITAQQTENSQDLYARSVFVGFANYGIGLDKLGRIHISQSLRDHAKLPAQGEVLVMGMHDHLQLWNEKSWHKLSGEAAGSISDSNWAGAWQVLS
ncbi:MAG: hypothetical protein OXC81_06325 [Betaproteobacteria bacterium]|nr:hypothetical protein [Betaproteobacteria bacterium]